MARIKEFREIPLADLEIGKGQARVSGIASGITELADSIRAVGLLEPIVVCETGQKGTYEILTGQRRFLAHKELGRASIWAAVLDEKVDEVTAKVISVTENLIRKELSSKDLIDACTYLFKKYGSVKLVAEQTGLPYRDVASYVKYDRLRPELKAMVDSGEVTLPLALRAQDAAEAKGGDVAQTAVVLAKEMKPMTHAQQKKLAEGVAAAPGSKALDDVIEEAKAGAQISQIVVTVGPDLHQRLQRFAVDSGVSQDEAAATLLDDGLVSHGYGG